MNGSELEVAYLTRIKHAKAKLRVCEEKKSFKVYQPDSAIFNPGLIGLDGSGRYDIKRFDIKT